MSIAGGEVKRNYLFIRFGAKELVILFVKGEHNHGFKLFSKFEVNQ